MKDFLKQLVLKAVTVLPTDIKKEINSACKKETSPTARKILEHIKENIKTAEKHRIPLCQDTGIPLFYVEGRLIPIRKAAEQAINEATEEGFLRPNIVHPITRKNIGNVGHDFPYIKYIPKETKETIITFFPKGGGSENMSKLVMLKPSQGIRGIKEFVLKTVAEAGSKPCPPLIIGVGIGGSSDLAMDLAKKALLRPLHKRNKELKDLELELKDKINKLGIGPMGLGGNTTALAVNIEYMGCNTNGLPVGINIQCWCARKAVGLIKDDKP